MRVIFKFALIISVFCSYIYAQTLEDRAFEAYKRKNYKEAVILYKKAAKNSSLKAILMLGLFSEQGIGVVQNRARAIKFYKYIVKRTSNIKEILKDEKERKKLNVTVAALKRLYKITDNPKYIDIANRITNLLNRDTKESEQEVQNALFSSHDSSAEDDFLLLCPNANRVPKEDREGIEEFDCALFDNFPDRMALFMKLRRIRFELLTRKENPELLKKVNQKIAQIVKPMIKFLEQEAIECYQDAQTNTDIKACDYDYLVKSDPLLFDNASYKMGKAAAKERVPVEELDIFDKERLINKLIEDINNSRYGKPYRSMVKL